MHHDCFFPSQFCFFLYIGNILNGKLGLDYTIIMLCLTTVGIFRTQSTGDTIERLNYGVIFREDISLYIAKESCLHTFHIDLLVTVDFSHVSMFKGFSCPRMSTQWSLSFIIYRLPWRPIYLTPLYQFILLYLKLSHLMHPVVNYHSFLLLAI
jgi:hypothetical protein